MSTKITRKSYKRNKLVLGASLFAGVALVSTGFAAWVISTNVKKEATGNVEVGAVENNSVVIKLDNATPGNFRFDVDTATGYTSTDDVFKITGKEGQLESLSVKITGTVTVGTSVTNFTGLNFKMDTNAGIDAALGTGTGATDNKNKYISAPTCYTTDGFDLTVKTDAKSTVNEISEDGVYPTTSGSTTEYVFQYTASFAWGDYFKGKDNSVNPAKYFVGAYNFITGSTDVLGVFDSNDQLPYKLNSTDTKVESGDDVIELSNYILSDLETQVNKGKTSGSDENKYKITVSAKTGA